jgi:hypothetical protein
MPNSQGKSMMKMKKRLIQKNKIINRVSTSIDIDLLDRAALPGLSAVVDHIRVLFE